MSEEEEGNDDVVFTPTSGFLEITAIVITPVVFEGMTIGTTFSLLELLLSSLTSMIFVFLPFHAFFGGCGAPAVVVVEAVAFAFEATIGSLLEPESIACWGVGAATGEVGLAPSMLSLRPFQAIAVRGLFVAWRGVGGMVRIKKMTLQLSAGSPLASRSTRQLLTIAQPPAAPDTSPPRHVQSQVAMRE